MLSPGRQPSCDVSLDISTANVSLGSGSILVESLDATTTGVGMTTARSIELHRHHREVHHPFSTTVEK
jgi:hypothetical protein